MPQVVNLDSIAAEKPKFGEKDTRNIKVFYQDPKDQINQYRFVLFVNDKQIKDIYAVNDDFNNGNQVSVTLRPNEDVDINSGDKIRVEMIGIDKNIYQYWYSLMQQSAGAGITPSNPPLILARLYLVILVHRPCQANRSRWINLLQVTVKEISNQKSPLHLIRVPHG